ncbi:MAG: 3-hydroxyacyl-CoA dehydrogenase/enoyl-CoA hydratase family protein [Cytophagales bacterium]|nr:3-hydroxyacyl-CoA dehydrogenase/enoyl-CoA hydratase family protein [Cytophagales bacterium]
MKRVIRKVGVLGSGIMGSQIACCFANIGVEVLLLDIAPQKKSSPLPAKESLKKTLLNPAKPLYDPQFVDRIQTGDFDHDIKYLSTCDWIIEAIVEDVSIKQQLFEKLEKHRKPESLITTNTSGIPISALSKGRSKDFVSHFCGTHFFNPPRYLRLLELIPSPETKPEILDFLKSYGTHHLGKEVILSKDVPAFIANRIGIYSILCTLRAMEELSLSVGEVEGLTGPLVGRPKSATFRTLDLVGIDVFCRVARYLDQSLSEKDPKKSPNTYKLPETILYLEKKNYLGEKTGQGFFKKIKTDGKSVIQEFQPLNKSYGNRTRIQDPILERIKEKSVPERIKILYQHDSKIGNFYQTIWNELFRYSATCVFEVSDRIYDIDAALRAGFAWDLGPFELWDILGFRKIYESSSDFSIPWIDQMYEKGFSSFYTFQKGKKHVYSPKKADYIPIPGQEEFLILGNLDKNRKVWSRPSVDLYDLGGDILGLGFHSKMNTLGEEVMGGIFSAIEETEQNFAGLIIGHDAEHFSAGANLSALLALILEQEFDEIDLMVQRFQQIVSSLRHSSVPIVVAVSGMCLGGGLELSLHADAIVAHAETYMGLVEIGAGLIPAGGGTKEMTLRCAKNTQKGDPQLNRYQEIFQLIGQARISSSAHEASHIGYLYPSDSIVLNRASLLKVAHKKVEQLLQEGYSPPLPVHDIWVQGKRGIAHLEAGITNMLHGGFITEYEAQIGQKLAYVIHGGKLSQPTHVNEQYLRELEREAFLSLCGEAKTLERIQHLLFKGKPLRN